MLKRFFQSFPKIVLLPFLVVVLALAVRTVAASSPVELLTYTPPLTTRIYDRNGELLYNVYQNEHRIWKNLSEIDPDIQEATIAMEDHRFYEHPGVDPIAILRALYTNLTTDELQGGSTLTQQYIKNSVLTHEQTYERKIKEAYLALILESVNAKDKILEKYLNQASYGGVYYGVEAASQHYFNRPSSDVSIAQAALLAALTKAPSYLSPKNNPEDIKHRQEIVINKMHQHGFITAEERDQALKEKLEFTYTTTPLKAPHFSLAVKQELLEEYGPEKTYGGGMEVHTTLDLSLQRRAQEIVKENINSVSGLNITNGAAVILNPKNGEVLAMVGSKNYYAEDIDGQYNVITAKRQPGSSIKPFTYALAFTQNYTPSTLLLDIPTTYKSSQKDYKPVNYDGSFHGPVTVRTALGNSYNVPATRMLAVLGVENYVKFLHKLGFTYINKDNVGLSLTLGGTEVRPLDMAAGYAALANRGRYAKPTLITNITDHKGDTVFSHEPDFKQVFEPSIAYLISDILADNNARTNAFGPNSDLNITQSKVAVKTGTSNDKRDNWAIGYTPDFVVAAWVGNNDHTPMYRVASGVSGATPIWHDITIHLLETGNDPGWYERPSDIVTTRIDARTGRKYCGTGNPREEIFIQGTEPQQCATTADIPTFTEETTERVLVERRDGQEVVVDNLSEEEHRQFMNNPFDYINSHGDILQADDTPTPIYVRESQRRVTSGSNNPVTQLDPLARIADNPSIIDLRELR